MADVGPVPIDTQATRETVALYQNLKLLEGTATLFGHQDALAYGRSWSAVDGRSDVKEVVGAYPSVLGFDVGRLENGATANIDGVNFDNMRRWIRQGHALGSVITLSWHSVNPVTGGGYGNNTSPNAIRAVLPGGARHNVLIDWLDRFAAFDRTLTDSRGVPIPIVFRPYHEHSGDWFWWGVGNNLNTVAEYRQLWSFTVEYLRDTKGLHNLLWTVSPDRSRMNINNFASDYLAVYPGDAYVDIMGVDNYQDTSSGNFDNYVRVLTGLSTLATSRNKLAAQTETGNTSGAQPWTGFLLRALKANPQTRRILWSLVWRNPTGGAGGAPYPGAPTAQDFVAFYRDPFTMFHDTLPDLYAPNTPPPTTPPPTTPPPTTPPPTTPPPPSPSPTTPPGSAGPVRAVGAGKCLDVPNSSQANNTQTQIWECTGRSNQQWTYTAGRQLTVYGNKCLDASGHGRTNGTAVIIWDCGGGANQQWNVNANGTITGVESGLCLDVSGGSTANGARVQLWTCNGNTQQQWRRS